MGSKYMPRDILNYVIEQEKESDFMISMTRHVGGYSIGEIVDKEFVEKNGKFRFRSKGYEINVELQDEDVITAVLNKLYVSAFISRQGEVFQAHFLVHQYPESMKERFEEVICKEVIQYMILKTIIALRLDNYDKVENYLKGIVENG